MTRKRFSKLQKAVMIYVVNKSNDPVLKSINKVLYKADYGTGRGTHDWLRTTKLYSYQNAYEFLVENVHKKMLKEVK